MTPRLLFCFVFLVLLPCVLPARPGDTLTVTAHGYSYWVISRWPAKMSVQVIRQKDSLRIFSKGLGWEESGDCNWHSETNRGYRVSNDTLYYYVSYDGNNMNVWPGRKEVKERTKYTYVFTISGTIELRRTQKGRSGGPIWKEVEKNS